MEINHRSAGAPARYQQGQGCDEGDANQGKRLTGVKRARAHASLAITSVSYCNLGSEHPGGAIVGLAKCLDNPSAINGHSFIAVHKASPRQLFAAHGMRLSHRGADVKLFPAWRNES